MKCEMKRERKYNCNEVEGGFISDTKKIIKKYYGLTRHLCYLK